MVHAVNPPSLTAAKCIHSGQEILDQPLFSLDISHMTLQQGGFCILEIKEDEGA